MLIDLDDPRVSASLKAAWRCLDLYVTAPYGVHHKDAVWQMEDVTYYAASPVVYSSPIKLPDDGPTICHMTRTVTFYKGGQPVATILVRGTKQPDKPNWWTDQWGMIWLAPGKAKSFGS